MISRSASRKHDLASGSHMAELVEVGRFETLADAKQRALALAAVGIDCSLVANNRAVALYVSSAEAEDARQQLGYYESENTPVVRPRFKPTTHGIDAALAYCAVLLFFFGATVDTSCRSIGRPSGRRKQASSSTAHGGER